MRDGERAGALWEMRNWVSLDRNLTDETKAMFAADCRKVWNWQVLLSVVMNEDEEVLFAKIGQYMTHIAYFFVWMQYAKTSGVHSIETIRDSLSVALWGGRRVEWK